MRLFQNTPDATRNLLFINILMFVASWINESFIIGNFALFYPLSHYFRFWQPVTHLFVHGNFLHLFFNMWALYLFGSIIENLLGLKKFLVLYFVSGLGAAALHLLVMHIGGGSSVPCVGASGAIYGLLCTYAMLFPDQRLGLIFPPVSLKARTMVLVFVAIELLTGLLSSVGWTDGIAHFAHLGGMLFAFLLVSIWRRSGTLFDR